MNPPIAGTKPDLNATSHLSSSPRGFGASVSDADRIARTRRLYLTRRRRDVLAPAHSVHEIVQGLVDAEAIHDCVLILDDLKLMRDSVVLLIELIEKALDPAQMHDLDAGLPWNHDARTHLTVILGYAEDIRRNAAEAFLDAFFDEFDEVLCLGRRILGLVEGTAAQLRVPFVVSDTGADVDGFHPHSERIVPGYSTIDDDLPSKERGLILVAEDHDEIRKQLSELLRRQGHEVIAARDGSEALDLIGLREFDLVITDINMPGADGFAILNHIKNHESRRDVPVIVVSGDGELDTICRCIKSGAEDYLPKPYNPVLLKARVDACLEKRRLRKAFEAEHALHEELIHAILPEPIIAEMATTRTNTVRPRRRDGVAVLFADIVGFTPYCTQLQDRPEVIVRRLQKAFELWEEIASDHGVLKIKTIGDAFLATAGLLDNPVNPVFDCVQCGLRMIEATRKLPDESGFSIDWNLRVGIHVGPVVAGVLGKRQSLLDLWGDTVNIAARLESHGLPGHVNLSTTAWERVRDRFEGEPHHSLRKLKGTESERDVFSLAPGSVRIIDPFAPSLRPIPQQT